MFFMRLRNHAKWVFVFLAMVFVFSFVLAGVGSGSTGIGDLLSGNLGSLFGGSSGPNLVKDAEKALKKAEKDGNKQAQATALQKLGIALAAKGRNDEAITAYHRSFVLEPNDALARKQLADVYGKEADLQQALLDPSKGGVINDVVASAPASIGQPSFLTDPIAASMHSNAVDTASGIYKRYSAAKAHQIGALRNAVAHAKGEDRRALLPALIAAAGDLSGTGGVGLGAYRAFLRYHRNDQFTKQIKAQIAALKSLTAAAQPASSG
jgi:hypothetical protein